MEEKYIQKIAEIESRSNSNTHRIDEQEKKINNLEQIYIL